VPVWACEPERENPLATTYTGEADPHQRHSDTLLAMRFREMLLARCIVMTAYMTTASGCVKWVHSPLHMVERELGMREYRRSPAGQSFRNRTGQTFRNQHQKLVIEPITYLISLLPPIDE
jgi:hypothetical protein